MVTEKDLLEDYIEVIKSGELNSPRESGKKSLFLTILLWIVIFTLVFWGVGRFY
jgi:hypothetical protein